MSAGKGGRLQEQQVRLWKEYIEWEKSNPQRLDGPNVAQRVSLAFDQALMPLLHYPEVSDFSGWPLPAVPHTCRPLRVSTHVHIWALGNATKAVPSPTLSCKFSERAGEDERCSLLNARWDVCQQHGCPSAQIWYSHSKWHAVEGGGGPAAAAAVLTKARATLPECSMLHFAAAELEEARGEVDAARAVFEEQVQALPPAAPEPSASGNGLQEELTQDAREPGTLVWIQFMRFSRRVDGVAASRKVFLRARRWHGCSWQVAFVTPSAGGVGCIRRTACIRTVPDFGMTFGVRI